MSTVTSNGIKLYYERHGTGEPLLLIAGVGQGTLFWQRTILPQLTPHYEVIIFDNRGIGQSEMPDVVFSVEMMAADTQGLIDALHLDSPPYIVGHSLGGAIAFELARQNPKAVKKLMLMSVLYPGPQAVPPSARAIQVLTQRDGDLLELLQRGIRIATAPDFETRQPDRFSLMIQMNIERNQSPAMYMNQSQAGTLYLATDKLANSLLSLPLALVYGAEDEVTQAENGRLIQQHIPAAQLTLIPEAGHLLPLEQPTATTQVIRNFFN